MKVEDVLIEETEQVVGPAATSEFQAETKKILDIVARSIYSDKEIFVRGTGQARCRTNLYRIDFQRQ